MFAPSVIDAHGVDGVVYFTDGEGPYPEAPLEGARSVPDGTPVKSRNDSPWSRHARQEWWSRTMSRSPATTRARSDKPSMAQNVSEFPSETPPKTTAGLRSA